MNKRNNPEAWEAWKAKLAAPTTGNAKKALKALGIDRSKSFGAMSKNKTHMWPGCGRFNGVLKTTHFIDEVTCLRCLEKLGRKEPITKGRGPSRRSISMNGKTYERLKSWAHAHGWALSEIVEKWIHEDLSTKGVPVPDGAPKAKPKPRERARKFFTF